jgi:hypothetical protein
VREDPTTTQRLDSPAPSPAGGGEPKLLLNRYRVMRAGVRGGFGTVLTCWDTRLQRRVAIKRIPLSPQAAGAGGAPTIREALQEARTASMLAHPNIVTVYDFEVEGSWAYLVTEYVDGLNLAELLSRVEGGTLTNDECSYLVTSVAEALSFAHENGVLHLDIKPTNIMVDRSGAVKLCDFGMATLASATGYGGARGGTVGYMPPEQVTGGLVDERTDVFSLAVVVWQTLTGTNPFAADTAERSLKLMEAGPKRALSKIDPSLAGMAEEVMSQALDPDPTRRIASVGTFADELVFGLGGDVRSGAESMRDLLSQTTSDDGGEPQTREGRYLPVAYRYPWVQELALRGGTAVACAGSVAPLANATLAAHPTWVAPAVAGCAALSALAPASGGALVAAFLVAALFGEGTAGVMLPALTLIAFVAWWWASGRRDRTSGLVSLAPCLLPCPMASAPLAAFCMPPARAAASSVVGLLLSLLANQARADGFAAYPTATDLLSTLLSPGTWVTVAGCACAAWVGAAVSRHGESTHWGFAGQAACCLLILGTQALRARVENGDIWTASTAAALGIAVLLGVLMCIATSLRGPRQVDGGVED